MTEIEIDEELIKQAEASNQKLPAEYKSKQVKFDDKGTLHLLYRDEDGKLLGDTIVESNYHKESNAPYDENTLNKINELKEYNKSIRVFTVVLFIILFILIISTIFVINNIS